MLSLVTEIVTLLLLETVAIASVYAWGNKTKQNSPVQAPGL